MPRNPVRSRPALSAWWVLLLVGAASCAAEPGGTPIRSRAGVAFRDVDVPRARLHELVVRKARFDPPVAPGTVSYAAQAGNVGPDAGPAAPVDRFDLAELKRVERHGLRSGRIEFAFHATVNGWDAAGLLSMSFAQDTGDGVWEECAAWVDDTRSVLASLRVVAVDADTGRPVPGVQVLAVVSRVGEPGLGHWARTGAEGMAEIPGLLAALGPYLLTLDHPDYRPATAQAGPAAGKDLILTVPLEPIGCNYLDAIPLDVRILDADGLPVAGMTLTTDAAERGTFYFFASSPLPAFRGAPSEKVECPPFQVPVLTDAAGMARIQAGGRPGARPGTWSGAAEAGRLYGRIGRLSQAWDLPPCDLPGVLELRTGNHRPLLVLSGPAGPVDAGVQVLVGARVRDPDGDPVELGAWIEGAGGVLGPYDPSVGAFVVDMPGRPDARVDLRVRADDGRGGLREESLVLYTRPQPAAPAPQPVPVPTPDPVPDSAPVQPPAPAALTADFTQAQVQLQGMQGLEVGPGTGYDWAYGGAWKLTWAGESRVVLWVHMPAGVQDYRLRLLHRTGASPLAPNGGYSPVDVQVLPPSGLARQVVHAYDPLRMQGRSDFVADELDLSQACEPGLNRIEIRLSGEPRAVTHYWLRRVEVVASAR